MQQDYILRMIQQLSGFVSGMLQLRRGGRSSEAIVQIEDAIGRFSGLSATLVHAISEDDLIQLLRARGGIDPDRAWALAELLREEALSYEALGDMDEATPRFIKSLRLYLEVLDVIEELPGLLNVDGLEEVADRVADLPLSQPSRLSLVDYFIDTARFDRAENVVSWSLDAPEVAPSTIAEAIAFYERLLRIPAIDLERGGLSQAEVEVGLTGVRDRFDDRTPLAIQG